MITVSYKINHIGKNIWRYTLYENDTVVSSCGNFESYTEAKNAAVFHKVIHEDELRRAKHAKGLIA